MRKKNNLTQKPRDDQIRRYEPTKVYRKGEWIFHPIFKDRGKIVKKEPSRFKFSKIIVQFENEGRKVLIENMPEKNQ
jgi:hypothetical protein